MVFDTQPDISTQLWFCELALDVYSVQFQKWFNKTCSFVLPSRMLEFKVSQNFAFNEFQNHFGLREVNTLPFIKLSTTIFYENKILHVSTITSIGLQ